MSMRNPAPLPVFALAKSKEVIA
ncbi:uncharacterized protein METZ01_LOCUS407833 [marine metagenome]|uniref:Uncharacterized protein n=1 Tax=marine metagenome TaxID=408172 RepID=A0A382W8E5_9ZZZZ